MAGAIVHAPFPASDQRWFARLRGALALTALALLVFLAIVFAARRLAGGFDQPLGGLGLLVIAALLGGVVWATSSLAADRRHKSTQHLIVVVTAALAAATLLAALTMPTASAASIASAWFAFVVIALVSWRPARRPGLAAVLAAPDLDAPPANLVQQLTRQRDASGGETLHALAEAEIPAGDRVAVLHLAFCPPLEAAPHLTAHALDAEDVEVKITTAECYGVRLEVRLAKSAALPRRVLIEVLGSTANQAAVGASL